MREELVNYMDVHICKEYYPEQSTKVMYKNLEKFFNQLKTITPEINIKILRHRTTMRVNELYVKKTREANRNISVKSIESFIRLQNEDTRLACLYYTSEEIIGALQIYMDTLYGNRPTFKKKGSIYTMTVRSPVANLSSNIVVLKLRMKDTINRAQLALIYKLAEMYIAKTVLRYLDFAIDGLAIKGDFGVLNGTLHLLGFEHELERKGYTEIVELLQVRLENE